MKLRALVVALALVCCAGAAYAVPEGIENDFEALRDYFNELDAKFNACPAMTAPA